MRWRDDPRTQAFSGYFEKQWLNDRYTNWYVYHTLSGNTTTNNPVEQYNKVIKRDYTLHTRTKLGMLLRLLPDCCTDESMSQRPFHKTVKVTDRLTRRARQMAQDNLLFEDNVHTTAPSFLAELQREAVVNVFSAPPPRIYVESRQRREEYLAITAQMGSNCARMEVLGQPVNGWEVNIALRWCPCKYHQKFGACVHLLFALSQRNYVGPNGKRMMANRRITRGKAIAGRPRINGPALSLQ
ncbi:hypothetical protein PF005_g8850 [Phytophthora fragariae]|uniref:SWIM-type domain-containing protein n=1 Tax=Phytophthora fragariae TaxID=53985 RepID=A0A6A3YF68_9STRA|nr:hypothetical protein PF003_g25113 [Phytophthora fragariae]KAE9140302.1 hypothetical protein PF006_g13565 [Phytophthora fragariae]KAE9216934.1 hypothetical protein PF005_g8850 [Phytophthora fragariae]